MTALDTERAPSVLKALSAGGMRPRLAMRGKSMLPALREGMIVELAPFERAKARIGDIVVFRERSRLLAHRIVATFADGTVRTSGDAQPWICEDSAAIDIVGVVDAVYESSDPAAIRIDSLAFRRRGERVARSRALRVAIMRPAYFARIVASLMPWRRPPVFATVHDALRGHLRGDAEAVARALDGFDENVLAGFAGVHGCATLLRNALSFVQDRPSPLLPVTVGSRRLADALQAEARLAGLRNIGLAAQIARVVEILRASKIEFALLKGAARLYAGDADAASYGSRDIDVFVPSTSRDAAIDALRAAGYFFKADEREQRHYRDRVHHAAPLYPPGEQGWIVEVHHRLARPGWLSTDSHWNAFVGHFRTVDGACGLVRIFDPFGTVLHHLIHGIGFGRYRDVIVAARAYRDLSADERAALERIVDAERRDPIRFAAMLALVRGVLEITAPTARPEVLAYIAWSRTRESLPRSMRRGAYVMEAWFASRCRTFAIVPRILADQGSPVRNVARIVLFPVTWLYTRTMRA